MVDDDNWDNHYVDDEIKKKKKNKKTNDLKMIKLAK